MQEYQTAATAIDFNQGYIQANNTFKDAGFSSFTSEVGL
jgi:hypothetical protein